MHSKKSIVETPERMQTYHHAVNLSICILVAVTGTAGAATDLWELPPIRYSESTPTEAIAKLAADMNARPASTLRQSPLENLRFVLKTLEIPESSQILVFSKTSKQNSLIHPGNPRSVFFNENSYVGYVPGGDIETITHDPLLGPVFHLIEPGSGEHPPRITRDTSECLSCHGTARTESVPGVLVRSVFPDDQGSPILPLGTFLIDHTSPVRERWGGYYVTGRISLPHLGNRTYQPTERREFPAENLHFDTMDGKIDTRRYLRPTSDVVALMVLEHQCLVHNQLTAAAMSYRRIHWLQKSLHPDEDPDEGVAGRHADEAAGRILDLLLFENEATPGDNGIEGDPAFLEAFAGRFPRSKDGRSLADFQLADRIFKYRCSYMVYSTAFGTLPARVKSSVFKQLHAFLESEPTADRHPELGRSERRKIAAILRETLPGWPPS